MLSKIYLHHRTFIVKEQDFIDHLERHRDEFYGYLFRQCWDRSQVEDVFSQAMLTIWEKRSQFREGSNFRAWAYQILTYKAFNNNKKEHKNLIRLSDLSPDFDPEDEKEIVPINFDHQNWAEHCDEAIPQALNRLSDHERACLLLRSIDELSYKEIAASVELPIGTVMTHLHRARKKCQHWLGDVAKQQGWVSDRSTSDRLKSNPSTSSKIKKERS
jgi:RNA polymerase sigma-70 factor (ECF subfamily)